MLTISHIIFSKSSDVIFCGMQRKWENPHKLQFKNTTFWTSKKLEFSVLEASISSTANGFRTLQMQHLYKLFSHDD